MYGWRRFPVVPLLSGVAGDTDGKVVESNVVGDADGEVVVVGDADGRIGSKAVGYTDDDAVGSRVIGVSDGDMVVSACRRHRWRQSWIRGGGRHRREHSRVRRGR